MKVLRDMEQYKKELIDFIYEEIRKAPSTILDTLKKIDKKQSTQGAKDSKQLMCLLPFGTSALIHHKLTIVNNSIIICQDFGGFTIRVLG